MFNGNRLKYFKINGHNEDKVNNKEGESKCNVHDDDGNDDDDNDDDNDHNVGDNDGNNDDVKIILRLRMKVIR